MAALRRLIREVREIADGKEGEKFVALMFLDDLTNLRGIIMAPAGSPIENYILFLDIKIPPEYPFKPPKVQFKNKVWHPKIRYTNGDICLDLLSPECWIRRTSLETILLSIQALLKDPGEIDIKSGMFLNKAALDQYLEDRATYVKTSKTWTERDNEGYGHAVFSDYRMSAIRSILGAVKYKGCVFSERVNGLTWKLTLVVVPNLAIYWDRAELVFQQYTKLTTFDFEFPQKEITLDFGDGMTRDQCWKITSLSSQKIRKEEVISDPRTTKPATCELELSWVRSEMKPQRVIHKFTLIGPQYSFDVCVDPDSYSSVSATERPTLVKLLKFPIRDGESHINIIEKIGTDYNTFGVLLLEDKTGDKVKSLESHYKEDPERINQEIFRRWLRGEGKQPVMWKTLIEVLHDSRLSCVSEEIEATFTKPLVQSTEPSVQSTKPSLQSNEPSVQSTKPSVQSTKPSVQSTKPSEHNSFCNVQ